MDKNIFTRLILGVAMVASSSASMAAANNLGSHTTTVNGSFVAPTCMVTEWPQDIQFDPVSVADFEQTYSIGSEIQTKSQGQFVLSNCPVNTVIKYTVSAENTAPGNAYQALAKADDGEVLNGFGIRFSATPDFGTLWQLDGTEKNLGTTNAQGELTVPAYAQMVRRGSLTKNGQTWAGGNFTQLNTYSISYD